MHFNSKKTTVLIISVLLMVSIMPNSFASNYDRTYSFNVQFGHDSHKLYISVLPSLYDYYHGKTHSLSYDGDYSKFVTPIAFESIAESIQNVTRNKPRSDEEFANAVLMLVHQVSYVKSDVKYPVETLADNSGKCDTLSLLAASIMKAGGLDVVLLYYKGLSPSHMNVGVYLPYAPVYRMWWVAPIGYEYDNKTYWIAECTPAMDWKVGDRPQLLANAKPTIISLENCDESSPAQVSSSLDSPLIPSSISINLSSENSSISGGEPTLTISGSISPAYSGKSVVMYVNQNGYSYNTFSTVTDDLGNYSLTWNFTSTGTYYIRTSWSGASNYAGADSETLTAFVGFPKSVVQFTVPEYEYVLGLAGAAAYELRVRQGVKEFLSIHLSGTGVLLSGEFIILRSGQTTTISKSEQRIPRWQTVTITAGMQPLRLPDDYNLTVNNQFGFILRNNGGNNYTASVRGLDAYDISQIKQLDGNGTAFMNASMIIKENTWYNVVARMSENETTAELYDINGTLLESMATRDDAINISEFGILLANNTDKAIAFKNLKVETLNQPIQPLESNKSAVNERELLALYINLTILLAAAFAAVVYVKKRKKAQRPTLKQTAPINNVHNIAPVFMFCFGWLSMQSPHQKILSVVKTIAYQIKF